MARRRRGRAGSDADAAPPDAAAPASVPWSPCEGGLLIAVRATPRGGRDALDGLARDAEGRPALALRVSAPPDNGRANAAVEALLARLLGVPRSAVRVERGATARVKRLRAEGEPEALAARLAEALAQARKDD